MKFKLADHNPFLVLLAFYFFLATLMLDRYPRVWVDEPWESITASTLIHEGKLYNPVLENYSGFDKVLLQPRLVINGALAPFFALLGVGHIQGRLASVICGALLLLAVYLIGRRFFSARAAMIAAWLAAIETMLFISFRTIRPEIYLVTIESFSLLLLFRGISLDSRRYFFWAGICAGVGLWTHPNGILHVAAVGVILLLTYKLKALTSRNSWTFAVAAFIAVVPYFVYVVVNDAQNSFSTFYLQLDNRTSALAQQSWFLTSFRGEWNRVLEIAQVPYRIPIIVTFVGAWCYGLVSKNSFARLIAAAVATHAVLSFLMIANKTVVYASSILPMLCILTALCIDDLMGEPKRVWERMRGLLNARQLRASLGFGLLILLSLNQLAGDARLLWRNRDCSYSSTIQQLQHAIPPDARVWGSLTFWFGFQHQPLRSQYTYLREVESFKPEYMITGDAETWGKEFWKPVRLKAEKIIEERGTLVAELPQSCYGSLRVYKIRW